MTHPGSIHRDILPSIPPPTNNGRNKPVLIVSRAGYELRKLAERGSDHYAIYAIGRARGPHENLWQVGSVGATTQWRNRRVKIDTRKNGQETGSARAIHPAFCVTDCANDVAVNDLRVVNVADRPFRKIHPPPVGWDRLDSPVFSKISRCFFFFFFLFLTREIEIRNVEREY